MEEKNSKISIMVIPKIKKVRRITISKGLFKSILLSLGIIFAWIVIFLGWKANANLRIRGSNYRKAKQIVTLKERIQDLEEENKEKDVTTAELQMKNQSLDEKVDEVEAKLEQIDKLKKQLEKIAGKHN